MGGGRGSQPTADSAPESSNPYRATLEKWDYDTFRSVWIDVLRDYWPARFVTFALDDGGRAC